MPDSIAHYDIISQLGAGGMGVVYLAQDSKLDRKVALKVLLDEVAVDEERVRRFVQEAKAASALNHPNILTVFEVGEVENSRYIATELVKGMTLRERLRIGKMTLREVLDIALQVATALNAAHSAGIVHRDIKPENIMIRDDGIVKVLDFGLAKLLKVPQSSVGSNDAPLPLISTMPGMVMGTVQYMSPEQVRGKETDARSDIWSLAVVMYEMLSGTTPFAGETASDSIAAILMKKPRHLDESTPLELRRIVKKALQKNTDGRYQTIKDLLIDVKTLVRDLERSEELERSYMPHTTNPSKVSTGEISENVTAIYPAAIPTGTGSAPQHVSGAELVTSSIRQHKFGATAIIAVAAIVLAGFGYGLYKFLERPQAQPPKPVAEITTQRLTGDGKTPGAEISPDGKFLAYLRLEGGSQSLWIKQIQTNSSISIVKPGDFIQFWGMTFSPDGAFVYFNAAARGDSTFTVYRAPSLGGTTTKVLTNAYLIQFSPTGDQISFLRNGPGIDETAVFIANVDGSNERKIASKSGAEYLTGSPAWSPDGRLIAIGVADNSVAQNPVTSIKLITVADGSQTDLGSFRWSGGIDLVWHPSGDSLIIDGTENQLLGAQIWEVSYPSGTQRRLTSNLNGYSTISITSDGNSIVTGESYSRSAVWVSPDLKAENAKQIMPATADTWGVSWTPDNRIAVASNQTGDNEIWIMDADGSNARPLTSDRAFKVVPVVSPDGRYIVYISAKNGRQMERVDIGGASVLVFDKLAFPDNPDISLDGKWVLFDALADGASRIFRIPIDGGEPERLTGAPAVEPRYSHDGTRFACFLVDATTRVWKLAVFGADGGPPLSLFDIPAGTEMQRGPVWTPDNRGITLVVAQGEKINLWLQPLDGGAAKPLTNFDSPVLYRRAYSRDGKRIAIVRGEGIGNAIMITGFR